MSYWFTFQAGVSLTVALIGCAAMSGGSADVVSIVCTIGQSPDDGCIKGYAPTEPTR